MNGRGFRIITCGLGLIAAWATSAPAQQQRTPTFVPQGGGSAAGEHLLGPPLGSAGQGPAGSIPGADQGVLGGRPGPSVPRVPMGVMQPGGAGPAVPSLGIRPIEALPPAELPLYGPLSIPSGPEDEGPADGLTLDAAIERLVRSNLELRALAVELPMADADILTASLRANPLLYADSQLIPYGRYSRERPGGPVQYDLNITYPLDVSGKRRARMLVACRARRVLEAQYQDAVRRKIDNLYTAFVDVLAARETVRFAETSVAGLREIEDLSRNLYEQQSISLADYNRARVQLRTAEVALLDAEETLHDTTHALGNLLGYTDEESESLELRGSIRDPFPPPPASETLEQIALATRPDLVAFRLGVQRAEADVALARANRFEDIFVLYQPFTAQDTAPRDAYSWALGVTVPLPLYNRNQGNLRRAQLNVTQTQIEVADLERRVILEVHRTLREYNLTRQSAARFETSILDEARQSRDTAAESFRAGEIDQLRFLEAQRVYNDVVRQYRDLLVRHRRSMLLLNTVVGHRILP
jgi:cobalt-zinc-cadmium efflux system outer membrane protein